MFLLIKSTTYFPISFQVAIGLVTFLFIVLVIIEKSKSNLNVAKKKYFYYFRGALALAMFVIFITHGTSSGYYHDENGSGPNNIDFLYHIGELVLALVMFAGNFLAYKFIIQQNTRRHVVKYYVIPSALIVAFCSVMLVLFFTGIEYLI